MRKRQSALLLNKIVNGLGGTDLLLSIIVPIYGVEKYINNCIDSILSQTFDDFELILVDDGSIDNCPSICDEYKQKDSRIHVVHKSNGGLVSARKAGIKLASGKYVTYVDGDDFIVPKMYEIMLSKAEEYDADVVICDINCYYNSDKNIMLEQYFDGGYYEGERLDFVKSKYISCKEPFDFGFLPAVWNKVYKRDLLVSYQEKVDTRLVIGEDAAVFYPLMQDVKKMYYCKGDYLYYYRQVDKSMSREYGIHHLNNICFLCNYLSDNLDKEDIDIYQQFIMYADYMVYNGIRQTLGYYFRDKKARTYIKDSYTRISRIIVKRSQLV